jgi:hypothetical protein
MPFDFCRGYASGFHLKRRRRIAIGSLTSLSVLFVVFLNLGIGYSQESTFDKPLYTRAVEYCRGAVARPIALSDDSKVMCFDGSISRGQDTSLAQRLEENGLFVVRSYGGSIATAMTLANLLRARHATVVVYDYCISACASYLLIASAQTYVMKDSLVAWHHLVNDRSECASLETSRDQGPKRLQRPLCADAPSEQQQLDRIVKATHDRFYSQRTVVQRFDDPPESFYVRKILRSMFEGTGVLPDVAWMWHPRYYAGALKTKIVYEAYPESQAEVDQLIAKFHFRRVIYDP